MGSHDLGKIGTADVSSSQLVVNVNITWDRFAMMFPSQVEALSSHIVILLQNAFKRSPVKIHNEGEELENFFADVVSKNNWNSEQIKKTKQIKPNLNDGEFKDRQSLAFTARDKRARSKRARKREIPPARWRTLRIITVG